VRTKDARPVLRGLGGGNASRLLGMETVSLAEQRRLFQDRWGEVCAVLQAA